MSKPSKSIRNLILVLGDQLDRDSSAFDDFDKKEDAVWMAEVAGEATHVWSHKARTALFLSAMRHFRDALEKDGIAVEYHSLDDKQNTGSFGGELERTVKQHKPQKLIVVEPGEYRVREELQKTAKQLENQLEIRSDRHFLCTLDEFNEHAEGRKQLRLEYFYREMRKKHDVLMDNGKPAGGDWNYDQENRESFGKEGPQDLPMPQAFKPDRTTREVIDLVNKRFADHPGSLEHFNWPVTTKDAKQALDDFMEYRLQMFGPYQDALWIDQPFLYHSCISSSLNLKLLNPRTAIKAAEHAYRKNNVPLSSVEGFIRQILGWREYVRGVYWRFMPNYIDRNELDADRDLPDFYWTGRTDMNCLHQAIGQTLTYGYAHHIQRLMITGLYALLLGVHPRKVHEWYLAVYVDAVEWVELPNTLGMSQFADGGIMASKPYAATGKYIQRMSNYCDGCRYNPAEATGENACPFTTLYWDFLMRNKKKLAGNQRMKLQLRNIDRLNRQRRQDIQRQAEHIKTRKKVSG